MILTGLPLKVIINSAMIIVTLAMGFVLHRSGKPYSNIVFNIHKILTLGFVIWITKIIVSYLKVHELNTVFLILISLSVLSIITLMASSGFMNLNKLDNIMHIVHRISAAIFLLSISGLFYTIIHFNQ
jgi:hypothetical protein